MQTLKKFNFRDYIVYISFAVVFLVFSVLLFDKGFLLPSNLMNILRQTAMISVAAIGMTFAISAGLIDLSTGGVTAMAALTTALILKSSNSIFLAVFAGLSVGLISGMLNGIIIAKVRIPAFLVTLGTSAVFSGIARLMTNLEAVPIANKTFNNFFGSGNLGPIPSLLIWTIIVAILGHIYYKKTAFGRSLLAVGGNESAARYSGIKTDRVKMQAMIICSLCAAFAGILYAGRPHGARYTLGENDNMNIIASVVIGGTSFSGGKGTIIGTIIGSLVIGMLNNGLLLMGLSVSEQMIARGIVIVVAVSLSLREAKDD